jgi:tripartite-type tricarboxylate transporter receptor subunit TctC
MRKLALSTLALLVGVAGPLTARAAWAGYPERPVRIVVGFGPGSAADVAARIVADELSQTMRQRFFIENKPGAGSNTAAVGVAKGEADGYTLFLGSAANAISASVKGSSVDLKTDLKPIALLCSLPNILVVHSSVQATTIQELIALAKADPGKLNYGSAGAGTSLHLSMELFKNMAGIDIVHVPYTGSPQAMQDLIGGRLHMMFSPASTALPQIEAGYLRPLAWSSATRGRSLPDLPTAAQSGLPGFDTSIWFGLLAPLGTPDGIRDQLAEAIGQALNSEAVIKALRAQEMEPLQGGPAAFAVHIANETAKWADVAAKAGLATHGNR